MDIQNPTIGYFKYKRIYGAVARYSKLTQVSVIITYFENESLVHSKKNWEMLRLLGDDGANL